MSVLGSHIAASVAGVAQNAQQLSRAQDKQVREQRRAGRKLLDTYEVHKVLEEHDEGEAAPRLVVDDRLQERPHDPPVDERSQPKKRLDVTG